MTEAPVPVAHAERVESLDVLRGFALLGILLLNIIGFGLISTAYSNPPTGFTHPADPSIWATMDMFAEGAMRGLFSLLFGAGVVMFTTGAGAKSRRLHYRRQAWLLGFGLVDAYVLLWSGDILITYALAGAALYWGAQCLSNSLVHLRSALGDLNVCYARHHSIWSAYFATGACRGRFSRRSFQLVGPAT